MNMKLKKILDDIQKTEDKIAELQEHLKRQNTLKTADGRCGDHQIFPFYETGQPGVTGIA